MKKSLFILALTLLGLSGYAQQASMLLPTQATAPKTFSPPNFLYVDSVTYRMWPVRARDIRMLPINMPWIGDTIKVVGRRYFVRVDTSYNNPSWINSLPYSKITSTPSIPAAQVNSDWNSVSGVSQILNKPNLSLYLLSSVATSTYQPIGNYYPLTGNPSGFISSYTETDPIWNGVASNYRTKAQNDLLYYPISGNPSNFLTSFTEVDPTVPSYSKSLTAFSVIKASTDPLYYPLSSNPSNYLTSIPAQSFASLTGKPTTLSGYGITDAYPLTGNPSNFLTSITSGQVTTALGYTPVTSLRTLTINGTTLDLSANRSWTVGTVTSVGVTSTDFSVSGSPVTTSGNVTLNLNTTGIMAGTYGLVTVDSKGRVTAGKRQEIYTGTTAGSGTYTVVYATPYSVEPNVIISQRGGTPTNTIVLSSSSTTGFTVTANNRNEVLGLLPTYPTLNGAVVNVIVTEK